jgi:hypothetical protein
VGRTLLAAVSPPGIIPGISPARARLVERRPGDSPPVAPPLILRI